MENVWSSAAPPVPRSIVCVGPPLSCSGPSCGSPVENAGGQVESPKLRLWPASISDGALQLPPALDASSVPWSPREPIA